MNEAATTEQDAPRAGTCICGVPVIRHFDAQNRKLTCEQAKAYRMELDGWALIETVPSSDGVTRYELRKDPFGEIVGCTCDGWKFRQRCRHVDAYHFRKQREAGAEVKA